MHMAMTERTQVLLSPEQRDRLEAAARERGVSVGALIRDAVDALLGTGSRTRHEALADILSMHEPVDDWEVMKAEIERGALA